MSPIHYTAFFYDKLLLASRWVTCLLYFYFYFYFITQLSKNKSAYRFFLKLSFIFFVPFFHFSFILLWWWSIYSFIHSLIHSLILLFSFITIIIIIFTLLPLTWSPPQRYFFSLFNLMFYLYSIYYIRYFQLQCFV